MSIVNQDGSLNVSLLEREVNEDIKIYAKSRAEDNMKKKAMHTSRDYDEFQSFLSVSQLQPISARDVSSLFNGGVSGSSSSFRNRGVHGTAAAAAAIQSGRGKNDYKEKKKGKEGGIVDNSQKFQYGKLTRTSSKKSSREASNFLAHWRSKTSSSSQALSFLVQIGRDDPTVICKQYFSTDIDSDILGCIVNALHLLMCIVTNQTAENDHNDELENVTNGLMSANLLDINSATEFMSRWLEALPGCGRFTLSLSFLTSEHEVRLKEVIKFIKDSVHNINDAGGKEYLSHYNVIS